MTTDNKTLADVQPGGRVRLGDHRGELDPTRIAETVGAREYGVAPYRYFAFTTAQLAAFAAVLSAQPSPGGQGEAREQFETWATSRGWPIQQWEGGLHRYCSYDTERMWEAFQAALAARQPVALIAQEVGDYRVTVAEDAITVSRGRDIVFAYSAGDPEPINARQPGDFDDKELQFYREHIGNDLDNMLMGAGVFEVTHEGGYEACWANSMDALKRLIDRKPVEFERAIPTRRRESAVELLLSLGFVWNNQRWEDRRQPVGQEPVAWVSPGQLEEFRNGTSSFGSRIPVRIEKGGLFDMPLYAAPPAQAADIQPVGVPERRAPVQGYHGETIPWRVHGLAWEAYAKKYGNRQSAERLAERGGFGVEEMDMFLPGWRDMVEGPPAQAVDLERFRGTVKSQYSMTEWMHRCGFVSAEKLEESKKNHDHLMALIDSQAVGK